MRTILTLFLLGLGMITVAKGADLLVTRPGQYTSGDKKTLLQVTNSADGHIKLAISFKIHMQVPGMGPTTEVTESRRLEDWPTKQGRWACCISEFGDVWLYDGSGVFTLFRRKADRVEMVGSCSEPNLGDQAPKTLKDWCARHSAEPGGAANPSQPFRAKTNRTSVAAGSGR